jgi:hypothetical protein
LLAAPDRSSHSGLPLETPRPMVASRVRTNSRSFGRAPIPVPSVFVMMSVIPESRVGRNACNTSIVKLTNRPKDDGRYHGTVKPSHRREICKEKESKGDEASDVDHDILVIIQTGVELIPEAHSEKVRSEQNNILECKDRSRNRSAWRVPLRKLSAGAADRCVCTADRSF